MKRIIFTISVALSLVVVCGCQPFDEFMYGFNQGMLSQPFYYNPDMGYNFYSDYDVEWENNMLRMEMQMQNMLLQEQIEQQNWLP